MSEKIERFCRSLVTRRRNGGKSVIFKTVSRENQVCNHIFLLHHSVAGTRLKLQSKIKTNLWKGFFVLLDLNVADQVIYIQLVLLPNVILNFSSQSFKF